MRAVCSLFVAASVFWSVCEALPADDVVPLFNREYFPAIHELFNGAKEEILVLMFTARYYPNYPEDANSVLLQDLIQAQKRGVKVKVILDASDWNRSNTQKNVAFADTLRSAGVEVFFDPPDVTSHDKLIIVDNYVVVVGSTNWSYYALERNNEASVLIRSREVAQAYKRHFEDVLRLSTVEPPSYLR